MTELQPTFDSDGYPTDETLEIVKNWDYNDFKGLMRYCQEAWRYDNYWRSHDFKEFVLYDISTAGWSGNESIIGAMQDNVIFWITCWEQSRRGGHYIFKVMN